MGRAAYVHWTFQKLDVESDLLARGLTAIGIGPGVRAVLMVRPGLEFFALTFGLFKAGAVPVLIDPGMGIRSLGRCLAEAEPEAFIGIPRAQLARRLFGWGRRTIRTLVTVEPGSRSTVINAPGQRHHTIGDLATIGASQGRFEIAPASSDETAAILFTSGSTGPPKGVVYSHAIFNAQIDMLRDLYVIEPGEVDLCTFPLFALFAPALGMTSIVPEMDASRPARADPKTLVDAIESFGVTNMFGSPALIRRVADHGTRHEIKLSTLRRVISAGAPVPAKVLERFATLLSPGAQIFTPYGATESLPVASIGSKEILGETRQATDRGEGVCVGRPVPGMRLEIIRISDEPIARWSDDWKVPDGEIGEFVVAGPVVTRSYFQRPESTRLAKIEADQGVVMHRMGDLGYRDDQGRLWFCGRKAHRVVTGSETLYTIPCEAVFNTHSEVHRTALVGIGPPGRQRPVLCVEPVHWPLSRADQSRILDDLKAIGARFAHTKIINKFVFRKIFPVDTRHNAKIFREKLALWAARRVS